MGTAITPDQVETLSGVVDEVVLALDADEAGQEAMLRAQRVAGDRRMRLRVASMPKGVDPAELMAEDDGADRFRGFVKGAAELTDFQVMRIIDRIDTASPVERDGALAEVARSSPRWKKAPASRSWCARWRTGSTWSRRW